MCIIIAKKKGIPLPSNIVDLIRTCFSRNQDGAGMMIKRAGTSEIFISKGYMHCHEIIEAVNKADIHRNDEFVLHFRIGTSGLKDKKMTHPFVVSQSEDIILSNNIFVKLPCIAHNGIFSNFAKARDDKSDTFYFTRDLLGKFNPNDGRRKKLKWQTKFRKAMRYNRLAVMYPDRDMELLGSYIYSKGLFFSNRGFKSYSMHSPNTCYYGDNYTD